ncbi:MAG: septal ring lytic transglycosylase RlpA family protein [Gammaproteobacteria bacterium]|nr:septal ring lytic transglycosylase RlpA family protein [Gammaproteobacteria bacterium]
MDFDGAKRKLESCFKLVFVWLVCIVMVAACSSPLSKKDSAPKKSSTRVDRSEKVIPKVEPKSKYGNPKSYVVFGQRYYTLSTAKGYVEQGIASWYGTKFHGRRTSSGETYDMYAMTAAHKTLPLPTYARVTNKKNGRSIIVRINDRGPFHDNRIIDLSYAAATKLGIVTTGTGLVEVRAIDPRRSASVQANKPGQKPVLPKDVVDVAEPVSNTASSVEIVEPSPSAEEVEKKVGIFVQIGAFRSKENAYKFRNQFAAHQLGTVSVKEQILEDLPIYKVWIGPLDTVEQADRTVKKITQLGHKEYKLIFQDKL